jgi:hypothetical protein
MLYEVRRNLFQLLLVFSFLGIINSSCNTVRYAKSVPDQPLQEYYSFSKAKKIVNNSVDTCVAYIYTDDVVRTYKNGNTETVRTYMFLVFKIDGTAFFSKHSREPITAENIHNLGGQYCFYRNSSKNIEVEFFDHNLK